MPPLIAFLLLCILAFTVWILAWSIISFIRIRDLGGRIEELRTSLSRQSAALEELREKVGPASAPTPVPPPVAIIPPAPLPPEWVPPVAPLEEPTPARPSLAPPPLLASTVSAPPASGGEGALNDITLPPFRDNATPPPLLPPVPGSPAESARPAINWEMFMGVKLFMWIGGLALFLGVAFFIKYSFDNNLISPAVRMALGYLAGAGLLAGGVALARRPYRVQAETLCGTGVVILYAVTFACRSIYHFAFFGMLPTFLLMVLITATAFVVAVALQAQVVALLGMLGGFLTPVLLSTGVDNPLGLFGYIALLDAGLLAVALHRRWHYLGALAAVGTVVMQIGWVATFFAAAKIYTALNVFLGFDVLFLLASAAAQRRAGAARWLAGAAAGVALVSLGFAFYLLDYSKVAQQPWLLFAFVLGADLCLLVLAVLDAPLARLHLAAGTLAFLFLAAWIGGHADNALLSWALGACFVFAVLHTVFPLVLQRVRPAAAPAWWAHLFPPVALLLVLLTIARLPDVSLLVWLLVLAVDLLAIGAALATGALLAVAATLVLTLIATGLWILQVPLELADLSTTLLLAGGFGVLFFGAGVYALRKLARGPAADAAAPAWLTDPAGAEHLPAFSAALPVLLLVLVLLRLPLATPSPVFGLALLLAVLLLGLARMLENGLLPLVALGGTALLEYVWLEHGFSAAAASVTLAWNIGFYALFAIFPFVFRRRFDRRLLPWVASALAAPVHFYLVYELVRRAWPNDFMGLIPALFALPALAGLVTALQAMPADAPRRLDVLAWFGGAALLFVTLVFPIQFERQWITLGWALEGAALLWLFHRVPHGGLRLAGVGLLLAAFVRLALNPAVLAYHPRTATAVFNWYLYAYGLTTLCLLAGARLLAPPRERVLGSNAPAVLSTLAGVLAFLLLNIEIADYYNPAGRVLTFEFSGNFARDMTSTIGWALFAFGLLVIGIGRRVRATRYAAIGLLSVTLLKLFLHDLARLDQLYRIAAFVVVALVAILASFLYQRFLPPSTKD
ncbi:MAG TPA: DUF2339 domain-containing protein [Opitutaceae bacterium]|nr:DUF2339 domain-containing protein [Opitutaceae bacterium]